MRPPATDLVGHTGLVATLAASQGLAALLNLMRAKSVAVWLGPVGVGTVSLVDQIVYVVAFTAALALPHAGVRFLARAHSEGSRPFAETYGLFVQTLLIVAGSVAVVASLLTVWWPALWGEALASQPGVMVLALLAVPMMGLHGLQLNVFAALQRPKLAGLARLGSTALMAGGAIAGLLLSGLTGLFAGNALAALLAAVVMLWYTRRQFDVPLPWRSGWHWRAWLRRPDVLRFCAMTYAISVAEPLALLVVRYALVRSADLAELGLFQSAYGLAAYVTLLLGQGTALYLLPQLNRSGSIDEKRLRAFEFQRHLALYATVVALPLVLFPRLAIVLIFSDAFAPAAPYLAFFALAQVALLFASVLQALLIGLDDLRANLAVSIAGQALLAGLAWGLTPAFGLWGAALACVIAAGGIFVACLLRLMARHGARPTGRLVGALAYCAGVLGVAGRVGQGPIDGLESVIWRFGFVLAGFVGLVLFLTGTERQALRAYLRPPRSGALREAEA